MNSNEYVIIFSGLEDGKHSFDFKVNNKFFETFHFCDIEKGKLKVNALLNKVSSSMTLELKINGIVELVWDRGLEKFDYPVTFEGDFILKQTDEENEKADEINIQKGVNEFDLSQQIYEHICLSIEQRHVHPEDENGESTCNPKMLDNIEKMTYTEKPVDERWNELLKLKNNNWLINT